MLIPLRPVIGWLLNYIECMTIDCTVGVLDQNESNPDGLPIGQWVIHNILVAILALLHKQYYWLIMK